MASNDTAALVVALSAQLTKFEKDMDNAYSLADKGVRRIEDRFSKLNPGTQFVDALESKLLKLGTAAGITELIAKFAELNEETAKIGELSETVGVSTDRFQQFRFAVIQSGGSIEEADNFLVRFSRSVAEAATGTGNLANFLRVNNINATQFAKLPLDQQLSRYGSLLAGASTQQAKLNDLFLVGGRQAGPQLLSALQSLGGGWDQTAAAATNAGTVIDRDFIERAKKSAEQWRTLKLHFAVNSQELAVSTWELLSRSVSSVASFLGDVIEKMDKLRKQSNISGANAGGSLGTSIGVGYVPGIDSDLLGPPSPTVGDYQSQLSQLAARRSRVANGLSNISDPRVIANVSAELDGIDAKIDEITKKIMALSTNRAIPDILAPLNKGTGIADTRFGAASQDANQGRTNQFNAQADAIQKLMKAQEDRVKVLQAESETVGKTIYDTTYLTEKIKLESEARKLNNDQPLSTAQLAEIDKEAKAIAGATAALDEHRRAWAGINSAIQFAGDQAIDVMDGLRQGTLTAADAVRQLANSFIHAAEQALLLGQGPLANILGMQSPVQGGTGGLLGLLVSGFRAGGGPVDAGSSYVVGEQGPEIFVPKMAGTIMPNGVAPKGQGGGISVVINSSPVFQAGMTPTDIAAIDARMRQNNAQLRQQVQQDLHTNIRNDSDYLAH